MTAAWTHPVEFVRVVASLMPRELEATITPVTERMSDAQLEAIIGEVFKAALILQRRMRTSRSFSRSPRLYSVEPADIRMNAFSVAFGGKTDIGAQNSNMLYVLLSGGTYSAERPLDRAWLEVERMAW